MSGVGSFLKRLGQSDPLEAAGDAELVRQFLQRQDAAAFEALVRRHGTLVLRVCQRELPRLADAEDAFQATFLVLAQKAGRIRDLDALPAWLAGVARRLARRLAQQLRRRREKLAAMAERATPSMRTDAPAWWDEEGRRLPEEYRTVIDLCLIQGLTRDEAARRLGQSPTAIHGLLYRARLKLKKQLLERGAVAGVLLAGTQASAAVVDRLAPVLAQAAVQLAKEGKWTPGLVSSQATWLAQHGSSKGWMLPMLLTGGVVAGVAWGGWHWFGRDMRRPEIVASFTAPGPDLPIPMAGDVPQQITPNVPPQGSGSPNQQQEQISQAGGGQVRNPGAPNQPANNPPRDGQSVQPQSPPVQQLQQGGKGQTQQKQVRIPVPPADRVPTMTERVNLAKPALSASGSLREEILPLLPHAMRQKLDGKDVIISLITSEQEFRDCTSKAPPVKVPKDVQVMTDPAWDGSLQTDWSKEILAVVVVLERANSVMLTPLSECWIPPDEGGVGHLLLSYAGAEPFGKDTSPVRYPYLMVNLPRQNLRKVAVTFWRPAEKPIGSAEVPRSK